MPVMDPFEEQVNGFLTDIFGGILKAEERQLCSGEDQDITMGELHLIAAVGRQENCTVSKLAHALGITASSVTIAVNKLIAKNCLRKERRTDDGRFVRLMLTERGEALRLRHDGFHQQMVCAAAARLSQEEKAALLSGLKKLSGFFQEKESTGTARK